MNSKKQKTKFPSELRFDLISKDWVVIATGRAKRPEKFKKEKRAQIIVPEKDCPFCHLKTQEKPVLIYAGGKKITTGSQIPENWTTAVVPNKFPAFLPQPKFEKKTEGDLYQTMNAVGFCEIVVTRDHEKSLALLPDIQMQEVLDAYQQRYLSLMKEKFVNYVSIFHNHGLEAGATQPHPHSQIITTPLIDVDLERALANSGNYHKKTGQCVYCQMNEWERKVGQRIVFENKDFQVVCPFASKIAFEVIISPKKHSPYFERITGKEQKSLTQAFQAALFKLHRALNDPAYNFYLHTAPCDGKKYPYYHWHWTILPKTSIWAGFEVGTRMEISTIEPEKAAEFLRKQ